MNILIILTYFNRPVMVKKTLQTIKELEYGDWSLVIVDDNSDEDKKIGPILKKVFNKKERSKILTYDTLRTYKEKLNKDSNHGKYINIGIKEACKKFKSEVAIFINDDDGVCPTYLSELKNYYMAHPNIQYSYCHNIPFNPITETPDISMRHRRETWWLNRTQAIVPYCRADSTQVSWRTELHFKYNIWFHEHIVTNLDADWFKKCGDNLGLCEYNKILGTYKGTHKDQLGRRAAKYSIEYT